MDTVEHKSAEFAFCSLDNQKSVISCSRSSLVHMTVHPQTDIFELSSPYSQVGHATPHVVAIHIPERHWHSIGANEAFCLETERE